MANEPPTTRIKICEDCGCEYEIKGKKSHFCPSCLKKRQSQVAKNNNLCRAGGNARWQGEKKPMKKEKLEKIENACVCDSFCDGCIYMSLVSNDYRCCNYLLATDKRRPCPPGRGSTVKETGKKRHRWREEDAATWKKYKTERQREWRKKKKPVLTITCIVCGKQFTTTDGRRRCCSPECTEAAREWKYRKIARERGKGQ